MISIPQQDTREPSAGRFEGPPKMSPNGPGILYIHVYIAHCNVYITNIRKVIFRFTITASAPILVTLMVSDSCSGRSLLLCDPAWAGHGPQATSRIRSSIADP